MRTSLVLPDDRQMLALGRSSQKQDATHETVDIFSLLGIDPLLGGFDRGYNTQGDVLTQTVDGRDLNEVWSEFQSLLAAHNERRQRIVDLLSYPVTSPVEDVPVIASDDFEEASEFGIPKGIRGGSFFSMGYDFKWYDLRIGYTWMYLAEATAGQVASLANMALEADNRLIFNKILKAIFNNANRTTTIRNQAINVFPFYNADGTTPPTYKSNTFTNTHTHYLSSGAATVDSGDLDEMATHLKHHGYGRQNGSTMILIVNSAQSATIRNFRIATGASYDFIPASGQPPFLLPANTGGVVPAQVPATYNGMTVIGQYGDWLVLEEDYIPAGYMFGFATGGEQQATNPVGFRQHSNASLNGLRLVKGPDGDYPLIDSYYNRGFGTGVRHRGAGVVMRVGVAAFSVPTEYA